MPRPLRVVVILVAAGLAAAQARAQAYSVPPELERLVGQSSIDDAGRAELRSYVEGRITALETGDGDAANTAREELIAPLAAAQSISVSFRLSYADQLIPTLQRLATGADEARAVGAIRIAGLVGTGQSVAILTEALASQSPAIRYAAAQGLGETLRLVAESNPALQAGAADQIIERLGAALTREPDAHVADAMVRALDAPRANEQLRRVATVSMAQAMIQQIRARRAALGDGVSAAESASSIIRSIVSTRSLFIDLGAGVGQGAGNIAQAAGFMAGQAMTWGVAAIREAGGFDALSGEDLDAIASTLRAAEALAALANVAAQGPNILDQPIGQALDRGDLRLLEAAVAQWTGPNGRLCRAPFNGKPEDFR